MKPHSFKHTPDNDIIINEKLFTLDEFRLVCPSYSLPKNASSRVYVKGHKHYIIVGKSNQIKLPKESPECDFYIRKLHELEILFRSTNDEMRQSMIRELQRKSL